MTEMEFYLARRMFVVIKGTVLLAPPATPQAHLSWFMDLFWTNQAIDVVREQVRGYVLGGRLVAYTGEDFSHRVDHAAVLAAVPVLAAVCGPLREVGLGATVAGDQPWQPRVLMPLNDYLETAERRVAEKAEQAKRTPA